MVQFNFSERTIKAKVVYYGPAQSGKTTNLEQIHRITDPAQTNRLISLNTAQDRTLFFDLLPFSLGTVAGYDFKVQLYTVPGQVQYNATRRVVLAGADAVVFVADSRKSVFKENVAAFENMKVNLLANRLVPEKLPLALQYNKQDLPDLQSQAELNKALNPWGRRAFPAVAAQGKGVIETFMAIVQDMLVAIAVKYNLKEKGLDPAAVPQIVSEAFSGLLKQAADVAARLPPPAAAPSRGPSPFAPNAPAPDPASSPFGPSPYAPNAPAASSAAAPQGKVVLSQLTDSLHAAPLQPSAEGLVSEELLHRSIRSNVELAEALASVVREVNLGISSILSQAERLAGSPDEARAERGATIRSIQQEAERLRKVIDGLGRAGAVADTPRPVSTGAPPTPSPPRPAPVGPAAPAPRAEAAPPPATPPPLRLATPAPTLPSTAVGGQGLDAVLGDVLGSLRSTLDACGVSVDLWIPPGTALPRCPPQHLRRALAGMLEGVALASSGSALSVRYERKPVVLRSREGEVKRDFVVLAIGQGLNLSAEDQKRILQGTDSGPMGQAVRLVREMGGFVRFTPGQEGDLETRVFLPAG